MRGGDHPFLGAAVVGPAFQQFEVEVVGIPALRRATIFTASPPRMVAYGQPSVSCSVEATTIAGICTSRTFHSA